MIPVKGEHCDRVVRGRTQPAVGWPIPSGGFAMVRHLSGVCLMAFVAWARHGGGGGLGFLENRVP